MHSAYTVHQLWEWNFAPKLVYYTCILIQNEQSEWEVIW